MNNNIEILANNIKTVADIGFDIIKKMNTLNNIGIVWDTTAIEGILKPDLGGVSVTYSMEWPNVTFRVILFENGDMVSTKKFSVTAEDSVEDIKSIVMEAEEMIREEYIRG